jgi:TolA-binding protein
VKKRIAIFILLALVLACRPKPDKNITVQQLFTEAETAQQQTRLQEANAKYEQVVKYFPETPYASEALFLLGGNHIVLSVMEGPQYKENRLKQALAAFSTMLKNYPESKRRGKTLYLVGTVYQELGDKEKAAGVYSELISRYSGLADVQWAQVHWFLTEYYMEKNDPVRAITEAGKTVEVTKDPVLLVKARYLMAENLVVVGNYELARKIYLDLRAENPPDELIQKDMLDYKVALLASYMKNYALAEQEFTAWLAKYPKSGLASEVNFSLATSYMRQNRMPEADKALYAVLGKEPENIAVLRSLAYIRIMSNKELELAENFAQKAVDLDKKQGFSYLILGMANYRVANFTGAIKNLSQGLDLGVPQDDDRIMGLYFLGLSYDSTGNLEKAKENYQKAMMINPANKTAKQAGQRLAQLSSAESMIGNKTLEK